MLFIEEIDFLVQSIVLQLDDEFIGYIFRFSSEITDLLHTNLTGVHDIFKKALVFEDQGEFEMTGQPGSPGRARDHMLDMIENFESPQDKPSGARKERKLLDS